MLRNIDLSNLVSHINRFLQIESALVLISSCHFTHIWKLIITLKLSKLALCWDHLAFCRLIKIRSIPVHVFVKIFMCAGGTYHTFSFWYSLKVWRGFFLDFDICLGLGICTFFLIFVYILLRWFSSDLFFQLGYLAALIINVWFKLLDWPWITAHNR